jgi:hypothetical protein
MTDASNPRCAFTLIEVLFALLLMVVGVLSILGLLASGSKAQQMARYRLYAGTVAMTLSDATAQHDKNFSHRINTVADGAALTQGVLEAATYGANTRPDIEVLLAQGGENGVCPVPPEIAARLEAPNSEIRRVLDDGGQLYYADARAIRGFASAEGSNPQYATAAPEMQQLVFAVVGYPQQNLLPQHPISQPRYLLYPFPPQARQWSSINGGLHWYWLNSSFPLPILPAAQPSPTQANMAWCGTSSTREDHANWEYLAQTRFAGDWPGCGGRNPWQDGLVAFRNLCWFGFAPIQFKYIATSNQVWGTAPTNPGAPAPPVCAAPTSPNQTVPSRNYGVAITDPVWGVRKQLVAGSNRYFWAGGIDFNSGCLANQAFSDLDGDTVLTFKDCFTYDPLPAFTTSFKNFVETPGLTGLGADPTRYDSLVAAAIGDVSNANPDLWRYTELGTSSNPRLPSLALRRLYLWLALKLWRDVTASDPDLAGSNPLAQDLWTASGSNPKPRWLHPARVLALNYVAHAAMTVTGMRGPLAELQYTTSQPNGGLYVQATHGTPANGADGISNRNAIDVAGTALACSLLPDFSGPDTTQATLADATAARSAHENCMRWAVAFTDANPRDNILPKPANRPTMLDRGLYTWDLFTAAGGAQRSNTPNTWQGAALMNHLPGYKLLPRMPLDRNAAVGSALQPVHGPGAFATSVTGWTNWENYYQRAGGAEPCLTPSVISSRRFWATQPFAAQARIRQLVFWAVDWKSYEDAESAPSAPFDVSLLNARMYSATTITPLRCFDPPEAQIAWWGRERKVTASQAVFGVGGESGDAKAYSFSGAVVGEVSRNSQLDTLRMYVDKDGLANWAGQWGADRNGNGRFDIGGTPPSTRLRAVEIARFSVYDPITWLHVRR